MLGVRFSHFDPRADIQADAEEHRHPPFSERDLRVHRPPIQFRPRSGRSSMRIKATRLAIRHRTPNANKPRKTCARSTPSAFAAVAVMTVTWPPRSGATPRVASRMAPMIATMNAAVSPRKKFIAPRAGPTWKRDTAFWSETVPAGEVVRMPNAPTLRTAATQIGGVAGFHTRTESAAIEHERPTIGTRL